jgi:hypothetical protein
MIIVRRQGFARQAMKKRNEPPVEGRLVEMLVEISLKCSLR